jgi:hypothetical protein
MITLELVSHPALYARLFYLFLFQPLKKSGNYMKDSGWHQIGHLLLVVCLHPADATSLFKG